MTIGRVALIGTGIMGAPMALNIARAGFHVTVWNRSIEKAEAIANMAPAGQLRVAADPSDAVSDAQVVIIMLSDGPTCDAVLDGTEGTPGVMASMTPGSVVVVMSSIPVETAQGQADRATAVDLGFLDAPVSGGQGGAEAATLAIMAGGRKSDFEIVLPVFQAMGRATYVGPAGSGQLAKLANQMIVGCTITAVAEALLLAKQGGADMAAVREALLGGFADSTILNLHGQRMIDENWVPGGMSQYQLKDMRTAVAYAESIGLDLPSSHLVRDLYAQIVEEGDGTLDHSAVFRSLKRRNTLPV